MGKTFVLYVLILLFGAAVLSCQVRQESKEVSTSQSSPNHIFILTDDMGYGDLHNYGASFATPHLDRMAGEGMRFTNFYAEPQCTPSRAALMTGCYPQRVGLPWVVGPKGPAWTADKYLVGLNSEEETLPKLLQKRGYTSF